jgi:glutaredoxin
MKPARTRLLQLALLIVAALVGTQLFYAWGTFSAGARLAGSAKPGDITMVSSDTCPYCKQAREWFTAHKVPFNECFIERDKDCAALYSALQAPGTPVLIVGTERQVGFDPQRVAAALARQRASGTPAERPPV